MTRRADRPDAAACRCMRATGPRRDDPRVPADPVLVATFVDQRLVSVVYRHWCGLPDDQLDPTTYGAR